MPHNLLKHSSILFLSTVTANGLAYLLHIFLARTLGPASYGELGSLLAFLAILLVPLAVLLNVIAKFAARFQSRSEEGKIGSLMFSSIRKLSLYSVAGLALISMLSPFIADFLHLASPLPVVLIGLTTAFFSFLAVSQGILYGTQRFGSLALNQFLENLFRLILVILLVIVGLGINGALLGHALSLLAVFLVSLFLLKDYRHKRDANISLKEMRHYALHVFIVAISITALIDGPTLFVKHFYSAELTGYWNASLNLARLILLFGSAVSGAMFGKVAFSAVDTIKRKIFWESLAYVVLFSLTASVVFFLFSEEILILFFGPLYAGGADLLRWMGFAVSTIGLIHVSLTYRLGAMS
ncbi:MAG: oligosaccharide flippase family protein [Deltaproteobacteria bacterium]|nr:oligosaccharide flippase family protein [Deltaproteobacteria bacterium]MBI4374011.1 oligosaccharide flippase family protein [Deltaproteobacteria bacterium]